MAKLSAKEQKALETLQAKAEAPDAPSIGKQLSVSINLGNKDEVELAKKYGFLPGDDDEEDGEEEDDDTDDSPVRRGFFDAK